MKRIAIVTPGVLPLPAVKGGAVECLIDSYIDYNEKKPSFNLTVFSIHDKKIKYNKLNYTKFEYIKNNILLSFLDRLLSFLQKIFFRKKNAATFKNLFNRFHYYLGVKRYLKKHEFDLIILENHCAEYLCLSSKTLQKKYAKKVIFHSHNKPAHFKRFIRWMKCTKSIFSVSDSLSSLWKVALKEYNLDIEYQVLKNGVDIKKFKPIFDDAIIKKQKEDLNLKLNKKIILFAGRLTKSKGIIEIINTMKHLNENYRLLIVGDYFYGLNAKNQESKEIAISLESIKNKFSFTGFVKRDLMPQIYNTADVVVLPSIEFDAAPLTLIESICCCKPVISTNIGGITEYSNGAGVILLDIENDLSLKIAESINKLFGDKKYYDCLVAKSKEKRRDLDLDLFLQKYEEMIVSSMR